MSEFFDVAGYEGYYETNRDGEVYSKERDYTGGYGALCHVPRRKKAIVKCGNGYLGVSLHKNGKSKLVPIHRILAETFIANPNGLRYVNHKDGNKENNALDNLEWCSQSENIIHAYRSGLASRGKRILCIETGIEFYSEGDAARSLGKNNGQSAISACVLGKRKSAYGFHWKYAELERRNGK